MNRGDEDSPPYINSYNHGPYSSSIASSASSSSASVWSDAASQSSDDSSITGSDIDSQYCSSQPILQQPVKDCASTVTTCWPKVIPASIASEQRQNPRRTCGFSGQSGCPPALVRQNDRKVNFVDSLVGKPPQLVPMLALITCLTCAPLPDSSTQIVEAIWPLSSVPCRAEMGSKGVLPLRTFIQETLRRSRTSYSTLQVALYYLLLIKPHVPKHDFTMEQPEDVHSIRALQCGRRMFLSALILASKYLQDRNYSARAWSKISGLNTLEINQNEMAFLLAVNWRLHITESVYQRWNDIVLKYTPTQPPSPGTASVRHSAERATWKAIILKLDPELNNVDEIMAKPYTKTALQGMVTPSSNQYVEPSFTYGTSSSNESTPTPRYYTPQIMEPSPTALYAQNKPAPALGLLPTPRLTPQSTGFTTPAVSAVPYSLSKSSMGYAMAQASGVCAMSNLDKWHQPTSSPQNLSQPRRSSLANSVSSASSPESMISDSSSRSSRSSSISSASSLMSAPFSSKLDVQARCRYAKLCSEKNSKSTIVSVAGGQDMTPTSSPESYTGPVGKDLLDLSLETPLASQQNSVDYLTCDLVTDAARALQDLHNYPRSTEGARPSLAKSRTGSKRSRPQSIDHGSLQDNVRDMLMAADDTTSQGWSNGVVHRKPSQDAAARTATRPMASASGRKRVCCATEATQAYTDINAHLQAFTGPNRPGMWDGILN
jgi:hypothetical protein